MSDLSILIVEGNIREDSEFFIKAAGASAADNLKNLILKIEPSTNTEIINPGHDDETANALKDMSKYNGIVFTGGAMRINDMTDVIKKHMGEDKITETIKSSKSINDLIIESSEYGKVKWIHIDVEGMDGELIYAINDDLLPELLLFESLHMDNEYYNKLCNYLTVIGYSITKSGWNTICRK